MMVMRAIMSKQLLQLSSCSTFSSNTFKSFGTFARLFCLVQRDQGGTNRICTASLSGMSKHSELLSLYPSKLTILTPALSCNIVPSRQYGRKVKPKPQKITHFEYSGDLRNLPELDKNTLLYTFRPLEDQLEDNEVVRKLTSLEFASAKELAHHRKELIRDRIVELFGPNSELEQEIALLTLGIRQMIPYCVQYRTDKLNKIWLLKRIFRRRRLLTRLRELDHERFEWLLRELKIRYVIPKDREEWKGWKHNLREATRDEATAKQRKKLEDLKAKFEEEKKSFYEYKAKVLSEIERDLERFGMSRGLLEELQVVEKEEAKAEHGKQGGKGQSPPS